MAKVMDPLHSSEARGRVQGLQFNTWRGSRFVKTQTSPAQPRSKLQLQIRAWTVYLVRLWATIGDASRANWNNYAATHPGTDWTNSPKRLTGLNWYVRCNIRLLMFAWAKITEPPDFAAPAAPEAFAAGNGILQSVLSWTPIAHAWIAVDFYMFGPHSAGLAAKIQRAKHEAIGDGNAGTETITGLRPGVYTFWARTLDTRTGLASAWVSDSAIITAA